MRRVITVISGVFRALLWPLWARSWLEIFLMRIVSIPRYLCCFALLMSFCLSASAPAQTAAPATNAATPPSTPGSASVQIGGRELFEVTGADQAEALQRADLINGRLQRLIERADNVPRWNATDLQTRNGAPTILLGGEEFSRFRLQTPPPTI